MGTVQQMRADAPGRAGVLGLVATPASCGDLLVVARACRRSLESYRVVATGEAARMLVDEVNLTTERVASHDSGGAVEIASRVVVGTVHAVFAFYGPGEGEHPFARALHAACDVMEIPYASNRASAEIVLRGLSRLAVPGLRSNHPSARTIGAGSRGSAPVLNPFRGTRR